MAPQTQSALYRLGHGIARHHRVVIALWLLAFVAGAIWLAVNPAILTAGWGESPTETARALKTVKQELGIGGASLTVVFRSREFTATDPRYRQGMEQSLAPLREVKGIQSVTTFYSGGTPAMVSADGSTTYAVVLLEQEVDEALDMVPQFKALLRPPPGMELWLTGTIPVFADVSDIAHQDLVRAEAMAFPVVLVALLVVFGSLVAVGLPLAMGAISIVLALALTYALALTLDVTVFALNIITFLGLGLAIDYSLFIVSRFREEMARGAEVSAATATTLATAGRAVLFSGATVVLGMAGLFLVGLTGFRSLGIGGIAVAFLSVLIAITFLPAMMAVLGKRVNALALFRTGGRTGGVWRRLAAWGRRRPVLIAVPVGLFLLFLGLPLLNIRVGLSGVDLLPPRLESRQGWELASQQFGEGNLSPILIVARPEGGTFHHQSIGRLHDYVTSLSADHRLRRVESIVSLDPAITREQYQQLYSLPLEQIPFPRVRAAVKALSTEKVTIIRAYSHLDPDGEEAKQLIQDLRAAKPPGLNLDIDGVTAALMDDVDTIYGNFPWVILFVMATIYLALLVLFRSVILPLKAIVMNMLSLFASYGALVFIFQEGHFRRWLGFETPGFTQAFTPVVMFCIIFGLSMDYEVFLLSRIKEAYDETGDNSEGVATGLEKTGAIITSAAVVLALVAGSFATGYLVVVKALGVGIALAVLIDALVVRTLLVPALMYIMGRWNWWAPGFVARWLPGSGLRH